MPKPIRIHFDQGAVQIALGIVPGYSLFDKFGENPKIDQISTPEDIWNGGGDYTGQPTGPAETLEIRSSDVNDTALGTGARTVLVTHLLDEDFVRMPDVLVTLNGTGWVSLGSQTYSRCSRYIIITAGSTGGNVGAITLRHTSTTTNIFGMMAPGLNQTAVAAYTVPLGKILIMTRVYAQMARANGASGSADMTFRARPQGSVYQTKSSPTITSGKDFLFEGVFPAPETTDLKVRCEGVSSNDTIVSSGINGYLLDNDVLNHDYF